MECKTILIVEDDSDIREMLALALEVEGYSVIGAENGKEGLERLKNLPGPCLILLDLMMPVMNGWDFIAAMQKDDILAVIPIVIVSAFSVFNEKPRGESVRSIMKKPIELDELLKIVKSHCG